MFTTIVRIISVLVIIFALYTIWIIVKAVLQSNKEMTESYKQEKAALAKATATGEPQGDKNDSENHAN